MLAVIPGMVVFFLLSVSEWLGTQWVLNGACTVKVMMGWQINKGALMYHTGIV